jgi:molecular chaperone DnaJ
MPRRNLYIVLGIPQDASAQTIRSAYRRLAKQFHPDRGGPEEASEFQAITEAYRILSNPKLRTAHNTALGRPMPEERLNLRGRWSAGDVEPLGVEPLVPESLVAEPIAVRRNFHASHPSIEEEFLDWTVRYFTDRHTPKSGRQHGLNVDVILSSEEAEVGGILPIEFPAFTVCPACGGSGRDLFWPCPACEGNGVREGRRTVRMAIPSMVADGTTWEVSVPEGGLQLRVRVRIDPYGR